MEFSADRIWSLQLRSCMYVHMFRREMVLYSSCEGKRLHSISHHELFYFTSTYAYEVLFPFYFLPQLIAVTLNVEVRREQRAFLCYDSQL